MLVCARFRYVAGSDWGAKRYLNMQHLFELEKRGLTNRKVPVDFISVSRLS